MAAIPSCPFLQPPPWLPVRSSWAGSGETPPCAICRRCCGRVSDAAAAAAAKVRSPQHQSGQACAGQKRGWQTGHLHALQQNGDQVLQNASWRPITRRARRRDSRGFGQGRSYGWFALFCTNPSRLPWWRFWKPSPTARPSSRTSTTSKKSGELANSKFATSGPPTRRRVPFELVDAYAGGTLGMGPQAWCVGRSPRLTLGRPQSSPFARRSSQSLARFDNVQNELSAITVRWSLPRKITLLARRLLALAL